VIRIVRTARRSTFRRSLLVIALGATLAGSAFAQGYPVRPVRFIVPFPPGGSADILARTLAPKMAESLGQPMVVENRPGAGTAIGAKATADAAPDGYTVMLGTVSSHAMNPGLNPKVGYDPVRDFTPVAPVASIPFALVVHPSVAAKSVQELVALARARPGQLNYASAGSGTSNHLAGELFAAVTGTSMVHIPYKGSAPALNDLLAGQVNLMFDLVLTAAPHVRSNAVRALAVTGTARSPVLPGVPTVRESGFPGYDVTAWFGLFGPANVPQPAVARLHAAVVAALADADVRDRLAKQGADAMAASPAEFSAYVREEVAKWAKVVRTAGLKPE
jgi:tripartite-type tricarboxylate transporter receptor subunit TctC